MSKTNSTLTAARLRELFDYNPETGLLVRRGHVPPRLVRGERYLRVSVDGRGYFVHRLVWLYVYGAWPKEIDHINRDPLDNRLCNLREVTRAENQANRGIHSSNKSGYQGVSWHKAKGRWTAILYRNRRRHNLGYFKTPEEASLAYIAARDALENVITHITLP